MTETPTREPRWVTATLGPRWADHVLPDADLITTGGGCLAIRVAGPAADTVTDDDGRAWPGDILVTDDYGDCPDHVLAADPTDDDGRPTRYTIGRYNGDGHMIASVSGVPSGDLRTMRAFLCSLPADPAEAIYEWNARRPATPDLAD